jgi:NAD(P)-dependent dehydrogenase (short-subunit alcohol dehydrogenase family)
MDLKLKKKIVFISGSTSGIGFATARLFAKEGASVILNGRKEATVLKAVEAINSEFPGVKVTGIAADFSKADSVNKLAKQLHSVDILINNVGIFTAQSFYETPDEDWFRMFEINVMSGVRLSRVLLPKMLQKKWGRIIFVSSECAQLVPSDMLAYSTTKAALHAVAHGLAQLTRGTEVTVNTVMPGSTLSEGAENFLEDAAKKANVSKGKVASDFFKDVRTTSLLQRFLSVEEVASTLVYLCSEQAVGSNGSVVKIDGGSTGGIF